MESIEGPPQSIFLEMSVLTRFSFAPVPNISVYSIATQKKGVKKELRVTERQAFELRNFSSQVALRITVPFSLRFPSDSRITNQMLPD